MPDPNLQSYLAQHYLSGPKADAILARSEDGRKKKKKKSRQHDEAASSGGLMFRDDSDSWKSAPAEQDDEDGLVPQVVASGSGSTTSGFKKLWAKEKEAEASAQAGSGSTEKKPEETEALSVMKAGLRSKEEMKAARQAREERRKREEAEQVTASPLSSSNRKGGVQDEELDQQTVYRDRSGRRINVAEEDAALRAEEEEAQRRRKERETWGQGLVQRQAREKAAKELENVRQSKIERRADDADLNRHFREQERSDDPALAFVTKKRTQGPQAPKYKGPFPPNRFNIAPGYRWDGVDRSNGFEKLLFQRKNTLARQGAEARGM